MDARLTFLRSIGHFAPLQISPTQADHELLSNPNYAAAQAGDSLTYHGGRTITSGTQVVNVYLDGTRFGGSRSDFDAFSKAVVENGYYVSPDGKDVSQGSFQGSFDLASGITGMAQDAQLQALIETNVGHSLPAATANTLYCLILPTTLGAIMPAEGGQPAASSCQDFCGYHSRTKKLGYYYAVLCDTTCGGCHGNVTPDQGRQMVYSHEYGEWRSDPDGDAWYNNQNGYENGDECAWQPVKWGPQLQWTVQPLFVNGAVCTRVPPFSAQALPKPQNWTPDPTLPLGPVFRQLLADPTQLAPTAAIGALLAYALANPAQLIAGMPLHTLLAWLQNNPTFELDALNPSPAGQGWGNWLRLNKLA